MGLVNFGHRFYLWLLLYIGGKIYEKIGFIFWSFVNYCIRVLFFNNKKDNSQEQVAQEKAQVTEEKVINVGVLQLLSHPALDSIYKGMVEELARQGYEDGKNIKN